MIETIEKTNGELSETDLARFKKQDEWQKDRELRVAEVTQAWKEFQSFCAEKRCSFVPQLNPKQYGNMVQVELTNFAIVPND